MERDVYEEESDKPLTEPELIPCVYLSGGNVRLESGMVRFVGWQTVDGHRRVCVRYAIPIEVAREINSEVRRMITTGHH